MAAADFDATFDKLRGVLTPYAKKTVVVHDTPSNYYLDTKLTAPNGKTLFFAAVRKGKAYVSFHLFGLPRAEDEDAREVVLQLQDGGRGAARRAAGADEAGVGAGREPLTVLVLA